MAIIGLLVVILLVARLCYKKPCEHDMLYRGYTSEWDSVKNYTWSVRKYECQTCGCIKWIDTRNGDPYFPKAWKHEKWTKTF